MRTDTLQDAREQARHISEVTKAYAEGKEIQVNINKLGKWFNTSEPDWDFARDDYRVKPEERKPREVGIAIMEGRIIACTGCEVLADGKYYFREVLPLENTGKGEG